MEEEKEEEEETMEEQEELTEAVGEEAEVKEEVEEIPEEEVVEEAKVTKEEVEAEGGVSPAEKEAEEEAKPPPREGKPEEEEIVEERIYTVPLSKAWIMPPKKRAPRAMHMLRSFVKKHMKLEVRKESEEEEEEEPKRLVVSNEVNEKVWGRGIEKPPRKIRIRAAKDKDGNVTVYLAEGD